MSILNSIADNSNKRSFASGFRKRRFHFFTSLLDKLPRPIRILDIGGTMEYWVNNEFVNVPGVSIVLMNLEMNTTVGDGFESIIGNATAMPEFSDGHFDVVHSNSVIEHLFSFDNQLKMANEVRRVGKNYFIQSPNRYFPLEPHYLIPYFQFFPRALQLKLVQNFNLGHIKRKPNFDQAKLQVDEIRLVDSTEMQTLFPDGKIYSEMFGPLVKSMVAYKF